MPSLLSGVRRKLNDSSVITGQIFFMKFTMTSRPEVLKKHFVYNALLVDQQNLIGMKVLGEVLNDDRVLNDDCGRKGVNLLTRLIDSRIQLSALTFAVFSPNL